MIESPTLGLILGSAFDEAFLDHFDAACRQIETPYGEWRLYRVESDRHATYISFRHGVPHSRLPPQIDFRAQAAAFERVNCGALVINSSVGVLNGELPIFEPLLLDDLMMPDNRLPDGSACTMFTEPSPEQGHLVLEHGVFDEQLSEQLAGLAGDVGIEIDEQGACFAYVGGPRTKTGAENRLWRQRGADVNSMTVGPEAVLANELGIPTAGLVVGHKYSVPDKDPGEHDTIEESLDRARESILEILSRFMADGQPVEFKNYLYQF
jgi:5'-methylthioadenosine phosphorylase